MAENEKPANGKSNFDFDWKFIIGDHEKAFERNFDDSGWTDIGLPHDWSIAGVMDQKNAVDREKEYYLPGCNAFLPYGICWYRKKFHIPGEDRNKIIMLQFDGIYRNAEIFLNGKKVHSQIDGYTSFYFDITNFIDCGSENTIAVRVNNDIGSRWYSGSGIYRHAWLIKTGKLHIKNWGTFINARDVSSSEAIVNVMTEIINENNEEAAFTLKTVITDGKNKIIAEKSDNDIKMEPNSSLTFSQNIKLPAPVLWCHETPFCYNAAVTIISDHAVIDSHETQFGIRSLKLDNKKGLLINGEPVKMKGVCLHHDCGPVGAAVPEKALERRLKKLKEIGCNAIRTSHNQYSPEFYTMCDRIGIYVMHEFCDKWFGSHYPDFENQWRKDFELQISLLRNHPSIIFYSIGNENTSPYDNDKPDYENDWFYKTTNALAGFVRSKDPTRLITQGLNSPDKISDPEKYAHNLAAFCSNLDIIGVNYQDGFYGAFCKILPDRLILGTENYGYYSGEEKTRYPEKPVEYNPWLTAKKYDQVVGNFIWPGIDYLGEIEKIDYSIFSSQIIDSCGFIREHAYLLKSLWSRTPVVRIAACINEPETGNRMFRMWYKPGLEESWTHFDKKTIDIITFTNCETVELFINDKFFGEKKLEDFPNRIIKWNDVPFIPGKIKATGINNGKEAVSFELFTAGKPSSIKMTGDREWIMPDGYDVAHIELNVTDEKGILVPHAGNMIKFNIKGPGKIIGVGNGNPGSTEPFKADFRKAYKGKCLAIIQSVKGISGKITVEAYSDPNEEFLKPAEITIESTGAH